MLNVLEAFFRRPWLHLLPLILMLGLGAASVLGAQPQYRSVGTMSVTNESLLADLTNAATTPGLTFESPAVVTARQINELLRTNEFLTTVTARAGLQSLVDEGLLLQNEIRSSIDGFADGDNIVRISAASRDSELSFRLAGATIESYQEWVIESYVSQSTSTEDSLQERVDEKRDAAEAANQDVSELILENPEVAIEERSAADQLEYERLTSASARVQDQLEQAEDALDAARLQTDQAEAIVNQRLRVLDQPEQALVAEGRLKQAVLTMMLFGVLGLMLTVASVVVSAALDRTIRIPNDVSAKFGLDVLAVVPDVAR